MKEVFFSCTTRYLVALLLLVSGRLAAQSPVNTDSLFQQAQQLAFNGQYEQGRLLARQVLMVSPTHTDALLLVSRTFAWQHQHDSARVAMQPLLHQKPVPAEAYLLLSNIELWDEAPKQSLKYAEEGLQIAPSPKLTVAKAKALYTLQRHQEANAVLQPLLKKEPENEEAQQLYEVYNKRELTNRLRAEHQVTVFDQSITAWQLSALEYTKLASAGKFLARVNYAQRYSEQSLQGEVEAYPKIGERSYAYLNAGVSDEKLFPSYRAGAELYRLLPHKFEASLGVRALWFPTETVMLYTGHIGKYFTKQWVSFRPFLQRQDGNWQTTGILQLRQYLRHEEEFVSLVLTKGSTPTNQVGFQEISRLDATRVGIESQFMLSSNFLLGSMLAYEHEEWRAGNFRNRFTVGLSLVSKF